MKLILPQHKAVQGSVSGGFVKITTAIKPKIEINITIGERVLMAALQSDSGHLIAIKQEYVSGNHQPQLAVGHWPLCGCQF
jgi:hypothetical protein